MSKKVRVRFAPSPTGGLHLGGVRTVLYNYLFARQHGGDFVLRIEDTDQSRYVPGAEEYIYECLKWCGLNPDESPQEGGPFAPYRQSERKSLYRQYAEFLVQEGKAYYAFDRPEELESMRERFKTAENPSPQYDHKVRQDMRNSCSLTFEETQRLLADGVPHVIRIRMPENETVSFTDMIRGEVSFHTGLVDDKVLLKADGMPTYHLAVVVDDYLMKITHAFRGEEWLPSAPVHILLWKYLGWEADMPQWAHLPLILKPDGNGKLSKRDGDRLGFPVFAMNWTTKKEDGTTELTKGFREMGFLPEAFINMLAMLGWNDGTDQEIFTLDELVQKFSIDRVHKGGAKFDFEKAKWFNHEWIKKADAGSLKADVRRILGENDMSNIDDTQLEKVITLVKERCTLLTDFTGQAGFFFQTPKHWDVDAIKPKWNEAKQTFFGDVINYLQQQTNWNGADLEHGFKELATAKQIKAGEVLLPLRIMLVGGKFGPGVFDIAAIIGKEETIGRIKKVLELL
ncbi:glutamate--tRNA ligase [Niastella koreensis]|uniref:Glutamate--tRNA ligase n=2 Tax=Niastella koreensis TaxID=354356 RepID=G8TJV8_NIAKG|nr:glutamate--tRNA ligase [Niastella koreensis]AEW01856.1 glutamyl-tRNA synthetase [Niastella koreensis GR20-10]OQP48562.1 glutamate--tRNA ligase [Niastella koreensis]